MSVLSTLRKLILGETWTLPVGITVVVLAAAFVVRPMLHGTWDHIGGFVLLAGVCAVLILSVSSSAGAGRSRDGEDAGAGG
jgi:hypothetical protein